MTPAQLRRAILVAMRARARGLTQYDIAELVDEPEYRVRGELKQLRSDRLVRDLIGGGTHTWEMTARGYAEAYEGDQLVLA